MSPSPRARMVYSAAQLIRERGVTATGVRDVVERADAPRGSFQHYFPGGKDELVSEAVLWAGSFAADHVGEYGRTARRPTPSGLFAHLAAAWKKELAERDFARGCPVAASSADVSAAAGTPADAVRTALTRWESAITAELAGMGVPARRAARLSTLMLSTLEGAILLARVHRDVRPLSTVVADLGPVLDAAVSR